MVEPIPAGTVILLRDDPLQVLMILRRDDSSFAPSRWVFPGGAVDRADGEAGTVEAARAAAIREAFEETGIRIPGELVLTSRWITPKTYPKRFDAWFFLAAAPPEISVTVHEAEAVDHIWIRPDDALDRHRSGKFRLAFPTMKNLEAIAGAASAEALIESRRGAEIHPIEPVIVNGRIVVP